MKKKTNSNYYVADYAWTGEKMEEKIQIEVNTQGNIVKVGTNIAPVEAPITRLQGYLLPGFVNAHSHSFQSLLRGKEEVYEQHKSKENGNQTFWGWRKEMYK